MTMNENDELEVLGKPKKLSHREKGCLIFFCVVFILLVFIPAGIFSWVHGTDEEAALKETTIVDNLQHAVDSLLTEELEIINGLQGQAIVMEVETGRILAMAGKERRFDGKFQSCRNFGYQQEPGSTMKAVALLALLETGEVSLDDEVDTEGGIWDVDDRQMLDHNWRRGGYGKITLEQALEISSNIGISKTIRKVFKGKELKYYEMLDKMSFGKPGSIDGIKELKPMIFSSPKDSTWASIQLLWNSIGYERLMAPIQMLTFYNAIANNGVMVKPTLRQDSIEIINPRIASKENIRKMQVALDHVVSQGLGMKAGTPILRVAGKTGTAQVGSVEIEGNEFTEYHLSFCGYFPADAPMFSIIVSMNKLGLPASGGGMAGVVFHNIVEWMLLHGMPQVSVLDDNGKVVSVREYLDQIEKTTNAGTD